MRSLKEYDYEHVYNCSKDVKATKFTPLMFDVLNNNLKTKNFSNINAKNSKGWTALHIACRNTRTFSSNTMVAKLIINGADLEAVDDMGRTPLHVTVKWAVGHPKGVSKGESSIKTVELLLCNGANPNAEDIFGLTPIELIGPKSFYLYKLLKEYGANEPRKGSKL